jgi:hypothetical protein
MLAREFRATLAGGKDPQQMTDAELARVAELKIRVQYHKDESWHVFVGSEHEVTHYVMEIGSDDDDFHFYLFDDPQKRYVVCFPMPADWLRLIFKDENMSEEEIVKQIEKSHKSDQELGYRRCYGLEDCGAMFRHISEVVDRAIAAREAEETGEIRADRK